MKKLLLIAAVGFVSVAFSQKGNTSSAGIAFNNYWDLKFSGGDIETQAKELADAKEFIDKSYVHEETKDDPKTLMYYGKIYLEIPVCAVLSGDEKLKAVDPEKAFTDGFAALKRSKEVDTKKRYTDDVDSYCNFYRTAYSQQGINAYGEEKWLEAMGGLLGAAAYGEVMGEHDSAFYYYGGMAAYKIDSLSAAEEAFKKVVEWGYQPATSVYFYSQTLQKNGKVGDAETMLKEQVKRYPNSKDILIELINLYIDSDRKEDAVKMLNDAIALDPTNTTLIYTSGTIYENLNDFENAEKAYMKALELDPKDVNSMSALGGVYFNKGAELNNEANKLQFGDPNYDKMVEESKVYFKKAVPYLEQAVEVDSTNVNYWIALRDAYGKAGEVEKFKEAKAKVAELSGK